MTCLSFRRCFNSPSGHKWQWVQSRPLLQPSAFQNQAHGRHPPTRCNVDPWLGDPSGGGSPGGNWLGDAAATLGEAVAALALASSLARLKGLLSGITIMAGGEASADNAAAKHTGETASAAETDDVMLAGVAGEARSTLPGKLKPAALSGEPKSSASVVLLVLRLVPTGIGNFTGCRGLSLVMLGAIAVAATSIGIMVKSEACHTDSLNPERATTPSTDVPARGDCIDAALEGCIAAVNVAIRLERCTRWRIKPTLLQQEDLNW
mmetsp:Transcript_82077/g.206514  ORF Transcript_82077/g.206514 Transcript_82077/m.206514 type:complete len:264 (-) Transcript_82077:14-805(-)